MSILKAGRPSSNKKKALNQLINAQDYQKISFNMEKDFHKEIKLFALEHDMTMTDLILTSLRKYIKK